MGHTDFFIFGCSRAGAQSRGFFISQMIGLRIVKAAAVRFQMNFADGCRRDRGEA
jgi:hypothetical protein